jgi:hypothetical protein
MEVVLKKTKITKAIFNQIQFANIHQLQSGEVLGWVDAGKGPVIILQQRNTHELSKINMIKDVKIRDVHPQEKYLYVDITSTGNRALRTWYWTKEEVDAREQFKKTLLNVRAEAYKLGQFFL